MVAPLTFGSGITIGGGISAGPDVPATFPSLILNFDAANYSAVPVDGTTIAGSIYTVTTLNPNGSMSWSSSNGGIFRKTTASGADFLTFGPDYTSTSQAYTVMMVYRSQTGTAGRLLNANSASPDWLLGLWGSPAYQQNIFYNNSFIGANNTPADNAWQFIWATYNGNSGSPISQNYVANPTTAPTLFGTGSSNGGFEGLRLFGRYVNSTTSSEVPTADVAVVKVWDGVLVPSLIQSQWNAYKTRF